MQRDPQSSAEKDTRNMDEKYFMKVKEYIKKEVVYKNIQQKIEAQKAENKAFVCSMIRTGN